MHAAITEHRRPASRARVLAFMAALAMRAHDDKQTESWLYQFVVHVAFKA